MTLPCTVHRIDAYHGTEGLPPVATVTVQDVPGNWLYIADDYERVRTAMVTRRPIEIDPAALCNVLLVRQLGANDVTPSQRED